MSKHDRKHCDRCGVDFEFEDDYDLDICLNCAERELTEETHPIRFLVDLAPFVGLGVGLALYVPLEQGPMIAFIGGVLAWLTAWLGARQVREAIVSRVTHH